MISSSTAPSACIASPCPSQSTYAIGNCSRVRNVDSAVGGRSGAKPSAHTKDKEHARHAMMSHILGWGVPGILREGLLQDKVSEIPTRFSSVTEYLHSFQRPLLEEIRANIKSSIYSIEKDAPYISVVRLSKPKRSATNAIDLLRIYEAKAEVEVSASQQVPEFKPNDLLILWRSEAGEIIELREKLKKEGGPGACALALLTSGGDAGEFASLVADSAMRDLPWTMRMLMKVADAADMSLDIPSQPLYAVNVTSVATFVRIWQALHTSVAEVSPIVKKILNQKLDDDQLLEEQTESEELESYCASRNLNESQTRAVTCCVEVFKRGSSSTGVRMIQGPPGTGKTSTIVPLLSVASCLGMKCLVTAPTNVAIAGVATRLVKMLTSSEEEQFGEFLSKRFPASTICEEPLKVLTLRDVVLVGNQEKLRVEGSVLEEIYLPLRANVIRNAYMSWRDACSKISATVLLCDEVCEGEKRNGDESSDLQEFAMARLEKLVGELQKHSTVLSQALPASRAPDFSAIWEHAHNLLHYVSSRDFTDGGFPDRLAKSEHRSRLLEAIRLSLPHRRCLSSVESIELFLMQNASIVFSTVSTAGCFLVQQASPFGCAIIDEAAQLVEAETAILTCSLAIDKLMLVGDPKQLPATLISQSARRCGYGRSLMERLMNNGSPCYLLDTQYRMHPSISVFPNGTFYDGRLVDGENVKSPSYQAYESVLYGPYAFIDVADGEERVDINGDAGAELSRSNRVEAVVVLAILKNLHETAASNGTRRRPRISVGVITPYSSQMDLLQKLLKQNNMDMLEVDVNSVNGFQGQERDVIILSTVRANRRGSARFVKDTRRLNVAMTRARYCFWIVGHQKTLCMKPNVWTDVLENVRERGLLRHAADDPRILKRIVKAKVETKSFIRFFSPVSVIFSNKPWKVILCDEFKKSVIKLMSCKDKRIKILQEMESLASGRGFSGHPKPETPRITGLPVGLLRIKAMADHYLVWSVDVQRYTPVEQVIKFWNLVESWSDLLNCTKRIVAALRVYSSEYIDRCKQRSANSDRGLALPEVWEDDERFVWFKSPDQSKNTQCGNEDVENAEESKVNESLLRMKFYALSSGAVHHLLTAEDGSEVDLPVELNTEERAIIQHTSSCFVLGRSGTGKTLAILMKILQREQLHRLSLHGPRYPDSATTTSLSKSRECGRSLKQMVVTFSPLLCSAISKGIHGMRRWMACKGAKEEREVSPNIVENELIPDAENEMLAADFLPNTLVGVPSTCYPMVITFRKLLAMVENSVPCPFQQSTEVDYERFLSTYWPHFNETRRKGFDASTIFTEIVSVIKGSLHAVKSDSGNLSREDYLSYRSASSKVARLLDIRKRETVYDLFLQFQRRKKLRGEHDLADRVRHLYKQLASGEYRGDKMDFIYVDEVQDFTQAQLLLFSFLSSDPRHGFVFAGDTAQVIANGVSFRFEDARSMFYTEFARSPSQKSASSSREESMATDSIPRFFRLKDNYRSHICIVRLANSILELIHHFFPNSIDKLESETNLASGEKPVLLEAQTEDIVNMVFGGKVDELERGGTYRFGARQVVLVRDERQKRRLVDEIGLRSGVVLTINDCKGLEFEDVLIYNFFSDSTLENRWRVLYDYNQPNPTGRTVEAHPTFSCNRHRLLRNELMRLYVAVARTRQRLWIYEENEFCRPMADYWMQRGLIVAKQRNECITENVEINDISYPHILNIRTT